MDAAALESLILDLHAIEAVKLGSFVLKSGITSPIYLDLRALVSHPRLLNSVASLLGALPTTRPYDSCCILAAALVRGVARMWLLHLEDAYMVHAMGSPPL